MFGNIGPVQRVRINFDRAGRSEGTATVTYQYLEDAKQAIREFDGANAKGQPIRLTLLPAGGRGGPRAEKSKSLFDRIERPLQTGPSVASVPTEKVLRVEDDVVEAEEEDEQVAATHRNQLRITLIATFLAKNNPNAHRLVEARGAVVLENAEMIDAAATGMVVEVRMVALVLALRRRRKSSMRRWMITGVIPLRPLRVAPRKRLLLHLRLWLQVIRLGLRRQ